MSLAKFMQGQSSTKRWVYAWSVRQLQNLAAFLDEAL
jgi:hypothetical protein